MSRTSIPPEVGMALIAKAASTDGAAVGEWRTVLVGGEERLCQYGAETRDGAKIFFATVYDRTGHYAKETTPHGVDEAIDMAVRQAAERLAYERMPGWWKPVHRTLRMLYHSAPPWRVVRLLWRSYRYTWPDIR